MRTVANKMSNVAGFRRMKTRGDHMHQLAINKEGELVVNKIRKSLNQVLENQEITDNLNNVENTTEVSEFNADASYHVFRFKDGSYFAGVSEAGLLTTSNIVNAKSVDNKGIINYLNGELINVLLKIRDGNWEVS